MRRALLIGIDHYVDAPLQGCVADAQAVQDLLAEHEDGSPNFDCRVLISSGTTTAAAPPGALVQPDAARIEGEIRNLFAGDADVAVLFFAGHGERDADGAATLVSVDDRLIPIQRILEIARAGKVRERIFILDSCFAGGAAADSILEGISLLDDNTIILTACRHAETAAETAGRGLFSSLVCAALRGGAADVRGIVTAPAVYAFVDPILNAWQQRPLLKANVATFTPLRRCTPPLTDAQLRRLPSLFLAEDYRHPLDPSYEPESGWTPRNAENLEKFAYFQALRDAGLLKPDGETSLYHAAMRSAGCRLTALGKYYWQLATKRRL
jgi:hypothetical protein